jgi:alpha-tubulin suppressor-like RCC1 family protein
MTTLTLAKVKLVNRGEYSNTATYGHGDIVTYQGSSFVYKSHEYRTGVPLFVETYNGTITTAIVGSANTFNITFDGTFTSNTNLEPIVTEEHFIHSTVFEPGTKIKTVNSKSGNTWNVTTTRSAIKNYTTSILGNFANTVNNIPVTVSARRVANRTEIVINKTHWDRLSEGTPNYRSAWSITNTYLEGDIVTRGKNAYICMNAHSGVDPLFDNIGVWDVFSLGTHRRPHNRITNTIGANPFYWKGHPYIPAPNWGTANSYTGIPWNISDYEKSHPFVSKWNEPINRGAEVYRGEAKFVDGDGNIVGHGGAGYYGMPAYRTVIRELTAHHVWDYYTDMSPQLGGKRAYVENRMPPKIMQFTQGWNHNWCLMSNGQLTYQGTNSSGSSGYGDANSMEYPAHFTLDSRFFDGRKIVKIAQNTQNRRSGDAWSILLDEFGEVWTGGYNAYWNLGDVSDNHSPTANTSGTSTQASTTTQTTYRKLKREIKFNNKRIVDIFCGEFCGYALDESGDLWSWGYNNLGQLGYPTNTADFSNANYSKSPYKIPVNWASYGGIQKIVINQSESTPGLWVLDGEGHIWNCGHNSQGQLGRGNTTSDSNTTAGIQRTSLTASWTIGGTIKNFWVTSDSGVYITYFLDGSDRVWGVGYNGYRNLSTGTTTNQTLPVQALGPKGDFKDVVTMTSSKASGALTITAIDKDGVAYSTGYNAFGSSGVGHTSFVDGVTAQTRNAQSGQAVNASWQRVFLPNCLHGRIIDAIYFGDYEATAGYGHSEYCYWLTDEGELLLAGEQGPADAKTRPHGNIYIPMSPAGF